MKKVLLSVIAVLAIGTVNAQDVKFGAKLGANLSTSKYTMPSVAGETISVPDNKMLAGVHVGGFAEIALSEKFAIQPELLFSMEGSKFETSSTGSEFGFTYTEKSESKLKMNYINLPVLAKFYATEKLFFNAGPQLGFLVGAHQDSEFTYTDADGTEVTKIDADVKDQYKSINFSAHIGGGYYFTENIFAEARYVIGLSNVAEKQTVDMGEFGTYTYAPEAKINTLQISVGYRF